MVESLNLPLDIMKDILLRLPVKSLLRFRCVSQEWKCLISDSSFITLYYNRSTQKNPSLIFANGRSFYTVEDNSCHELDLPFFKKMPKQVRIIVVGSCNGLLCFLLSDPRREVLYRDPIYLLNPATRELKELPHPPYEISDSDRVVHGFGFDPMSKDYKVVKIVYHFGTMPMMLQSDVMVYSLNSDNWRKLGDDIPVPDLYPHDSRRNPVVNAAIHWLESKNHGSGSLIFSFDLAHEVFRELQLPQENRYYSDILEMGGCLSVYTTWRGKNDIWVMKEYGVKESWTRQRITFNSKTRAHHFAPVEFWNDEILFQFGVNKLFFYNTESKTERNPGIRRIPSWSKAFFHTESLVRLRVCERVQRNRQRGKEEEEEDD